ncbi:TPA: alpha/beta hydrolase [Klebsiella pneumoniae]|nr:alpha/beta hydrolase [Klebsiella pneumoniae]HBR1477790.1 alpha/beta hydrolase [Klebsiella pneumoniae]
MFEAFEDTNITLRSGVTVRVRIGGEGKPLLLLHGYPQTSACWHKVAPALIDKGFRVIAPDLRGYGRSDKPASDPEHLTYSKRMMAEDQINLMQELGYRSFLLAGHDRGARVAFRTALDYPEAIEKLALLDIAPTDEMYKLTDSVFATGYYHWFFLIQPSPLPERLISAEPDFYLRSKLAAWGRSGIDVYTPDAVSEYMQSFRNPACIHATCEDYRASATIDLVHDKADAHKKLDMPLLVLWGAKGLVGKLYEVEKLWSKRAHKVTGKALPCGHFLPEEVPEETVEELVHFFN